MRLIESAVTRLTVLPPRTGDSLLTQAPSSAPGATRRDFLAGAAATAAGATLASLAPNVHAAGSDMLRIGLIGCGSRGTGAAEQALTADKNTKLVAMGDMFEDRLKFSLSRLKKSKDVGDRV